MNPTWDGRDLLQPISADQPCGENLEDTPLLASFDAFRLFGHSTPVEPPPDWPAVKARALEGLDRSKDLRILAHLGTAALRTDGVPAFADTLQVAARWLDTYWEHTYPRIEEDAIVRRNALNCFADRMAIVEGLRRAPLVSHRQHGTFCLRDIDIAAGMQPASAGEARPDEARIDAAFATAPAEELTALHRSVTEAVAALHGIDERMRREAGSEAAPALEPLSTQLVRMERVLRARLDVRGDGNGAAAPRESDAAAALTNIRSREDALRAVEAVSEFFRRHEPSSPVPQLLDRAKRLVSKNFLEVLADIAPDALAQARAAGGLKKGE
jgi:type VI secretion system protein ImpA